MIDDTQHPEDIADAPLTDVTLRRVVQTLRAPVAFDTEFEARVMRAVRGADEPTPKPIPMPWWKRGVTVRLTVTHAFAMAATLALIAVGARQSRPVEVATAPTTLVRFTVQVPQAERVAIVGDFNAWDANATPLEWDAVNGVWSAFIPLTAGRHEYMFVVDGTQWVADPLAVAQRDEFGEASSVVRVPEAALTAASRPGA